jgi:hypothetical protein
MEQRTLPEFKAVKLSKKRDFEDKVMPIDLYSARIDYKE